MFIAEDGTLWIIPPEDIVIFDKDKLNEIIDECSVWRNIKDYDELDWQYDVDDETDGYLHELINDLKKHYNVHKIVINTTENYSKNIPLSIPFEVFNKLSDAPIEDLRFKDMPALKKFLNTPEGKELEGWHEWENYWNNRSVEQ